jgi:hypothetical protein
MAMATATIVVAIIGAIIMAVATIAIKVKIPEAVVVIEEQIPIMVVTKHQGPKQVILAP